jgi:formimidoylglutamate deiminase
VSPVEELRGLEYGQRLLHRRRGVVPGGTALWQGALAGGAQALGRRIGALKPGCRADLVVLREDLPALWGRRADKFLDAAIFAGNVNPVRDVAVGGRFVVREGRHEREDGVLAAYKRAIR